MTTGLLMSCPAARGSDSRCAPIMPHAPAFLYCNCRARAAPDAHLRAGRLVGEPEPSAAPGGLACRYAPRRRGMRRTRSCSRTTDSGRSSGSEALCSLGLLLGQPEPGHPAANRRTASMRTWLVLRDRGTSSPHRRSGAWPAGRGRWATVPATCAQDLDGAPGLTRSRFRWSEVMCGQGQDRTVDLPLFRSTAPCAVQTYENGRH